VLSNETGAAAVVRSSGTRDGKRLDDIQVHLFRLKDGKVKEIWQYTGDSAAVENFWG
jgi:ketosteroid isomerase-like protein